MQSQSARRTSGGQLYFPVASQSRWRAMPTHAAAAGTAEVVDGGKAVSPPRNRRGAAPAAAPTALVAANPTPESACLAVCARPAVQPKNVSPQRHQVPLPSCMPTLPPHGTTADLGIRSPLAPTASVTHHTASRQNDILKRAAEILSTPITRRRTRPRPASPTMADPLSPQAMVPPADFLPHQSPHRMHAPPAMTLLPASVPPVPMPVHVPHPGYVPGPSMHMSLPYDHDFTPQPSLVSQVQPMPLTYDDGMSTVDSLSVSVAPVESTIALGQIVDDVASTQEPETVTGVTQDAPATPSDAFHPVKKPVDTSSVGGSPPRWAETQTSRPPSPIPVEPVRLVGQESRLVIEKERRPSLVSFADDAAGYVPGAGQKVSHLEEMFTSSVPAQPASQPTPMHSRVGTTPHKEPERVQPLPTSRLAYAPPSVPTRPRLPPMAPERPTPLPPVPPPPPPVPVGGEHPRLSPPRARLAPPAAPASPHEHYLRMSPTSVVLPPPVSAPPAPVPAAPPAEHRVGSPMVCNVYVVNEVTLPPPPPPPPEPTVHEHLIAAQSVPLPAVEIAPVPIVAPHYLPPAAHETIYVPSPPTIPVAVALEDVEFALPARPAASTAAVVHEPRVSPPRQHTAAPATPAVEPMVLLVDPAPVPATPAAVPLPLPPVEPEPPLVVEHPVRVSPPRPRSVEALSMAPTPMVPTAVVPPELPAVPQAEPPPPLTVVHHVAPQPEPQLVVPVAIAPVKHADPSAAVAPPPQQYPAPLASAAESLEAWQRKHGVRKFRMPGSRIVGGVPEPNFCDAFPSKVVPGSVPATPSSAVGYRPERQGANSYGPPNTRVDAFAVVEKQGGWVDDSEEPAQPWSHSQAQDEEEEDAQLPHDGHEGWAYPQSVDKRGVPIPSVVKGRVVSVGSRVPLKRAAGDSRGSSVRQGMTKEPSAMRVSAASTTPVGYEEHEGALEAGEGHSVPGGVMMSISKRPASVASSRPGGSRGQTPVMGVPDHEGNPPTPTVVKSLNLPDDDSNGDLSFTHPAGGGGAIPSVTKMHPASHASHGGRSSRLSHPSYAPSDPTSRTVGSESLPSYMPQHHPPSQPQKPHKHMSHGDYDGIHGGMPLSYVEGQPVPSQAMTIGPRSQTQPMASHLQQVPGQPQAPQVPQASVGQRPSLPQQTPHFQQHPGGPGHGHGAIVHPAQSTGHPATSAAASHAPQRPGSMPAAGLSAGTMQTPMVQTQLQHPQAHASQGMQQPLQTLDAFKGPAQPPPSTAPTCDDAGVRERSGGADGPAADITPTEVTARRKTVPALPSPRVQPIAVRAHTTPTADLDVDLPASPREPPPQSRMRQSTPAADASGRSLPYTPAPSVATGRLSRSESWNFDASSQSVNQLEHAQTPPVSPCAVAVPSPDTAGLEALASGTTATDSHAEAAISRNTAVHVGGGSAGQPPAASVGAGGGGWAGAANKSLSDVYPVACSVPSSDASQVQVSTSTINDSIDIEASRTVSRQFVQPSGDGCGLQGSTASALSSATSELPPPSPSRQGPRPVQGAASAAAPDSVCIGDSHTTADIRRMLGSIIEETLGSTLGGGGLEGTQRGSHAMLSCASTDLGVTASSLDFGDSASGAVGREPALDATVSEWMSPTLPPAPPTSPEHNTKGWMAHAQRVPRGSIDDSLVADAGGSAPQPLALREMAEGMASEGTGGLRSASTQAQTEALVSQDGVGVLSGSQAASAWHTSYSEAGGVTDVLSQQSTAVPTARSTPQTLRLQDASTAEAPLTKTPPASQALGAAATAVDGVPVTTVRDGPTAMESVPGAAEPRGTLHSVGESVPASAVTTKSVAAFTSMGMGVAGSAGPLSSGMDVLQSASGLSYSNNVPLERQRTQAPSQTSVATAAPAPAEPEAHSVRAFTTVSDAAQLSTASSGPGLMVQTPPDAILIPASPRQRHRLTGHIGARSLEASVPSVPLVASPGVPDSSTSSGWGGSCVPPHLGEGAPLSATNPAQTQMTSSEGSSVFFKTHLPLPHTSAMELEPEPLPHTIPSVAKPYDVQAAVPVAAAVGDASCTQLPRGVLPVAQEGSVVGSMPYMSRVGAQAGPSPDSLGLVGSGEMTVAGGPPPVHYVRSDVSTTDAAPASVLSASAASVPPDHFRAPSQLDTTVVHNAPSAMGANPVNFCQTPPPSIPPAHAPPSEPPASEGKLLPSDGGTGMLAASYASYAASEDRDAASTATPRTSAGQAIASVRKPSTPGPAGYAICSNDPGDFSSIPFTNDTGAPFYYAAASSPPYGPMAVCGSIVPGGMQQQQQQQSLLPAVAAGSAGVPSSAPRVPEEVGTVFYVPEGAVCEEYTQQEIAYDASGVGEAVVSASSPGVGWGIAPAPVRNADVQALPHGAAVGIVHDTALAPAVTGSPLVSPVRVPSPPREVLLAPYTCPAVAAASPRGYAEGRQRPHRTEEAYAYPVMPGSPPAAEATADAAGGLASSYIAPPGAAPSAPSTGMPALAPDGFVMEAIVDDPTMSPPRLPRRAPSIHDALMHPLDQQPPPDIHVAPPDGCISRVPVLPQTVLTRSSPAPPTAPSAPALRRAPSAVDTTTSSHGASQPLPLSSAAASYTPDVSAAAPTYSLSLSHTQSEGHLVAPANTPSAAGAHPPRSSPAPPAALAAAPPLPRSPPPPPSAPQPPHPASAASPRSPPRAHPPPPEVRDVYYYPSASYARPDPRTPPRAPTSPAQPASMRADRWQPSSPGVVEMVDMPFMAPPSRPAPAAPPASPHSPMPHGMEMGGRLVSARGMVASPTLSLALAAPPASPVTGLALPRRTSDTSGLEYTAAWSDAGPQSVASVADSVVTAASPKLQQAPAGSVGLSAVSEGDAVHTPATLLEWTGPIAFAEPPLLSLVPQHTMQPGSNGSPRRVSTATSQTSHTDVETYSVTEHSTQPPTRRGASSAEYAAQPASAAPAAPAPVVQVACESRPAPGGAVASAPAMQPHSPHRPPEPPASPPSVHSHAQATPQRTPTAHASDSSAGHGSANLRVRRRAPGRPNHRDDLLRMQMLHSGATDIRTASGGGESAGGASTELDDLMLSSSLQVIVPCGMASALKPVTPTGQRRTPRKAVSFTEGALEAAVRELGLPAPASSGFVGDDSTASISAFTSG